MKGIILTIFLLCAANTFASTGETQSFIYDGGTSGNQMTLNGEATHTEYRTERRAETCWRTVFSHYERVCRTHYETRCHTREGRQICRQIPRQICHQVARYRQEAYTCYRDVQIPYEVHDHFVRTNFSLQFFLHAAEIEPNEKIILSTYGNSFNLKVKSSGKLLIYKKQKSTFTQEADLRINDVNYELSLYDSAATFAPITHGVKGLSVDTEFLTFETAKANERAPVDISLQVTRIKRFSGNSDLINRKLAKTEYQTEEIGDDKLRIRVDLKSLLADWKPSKKNRYRINLDLNLNEENLINKSDLPGKNVSDELTLKIK